MISLDSRDGRKGLRMGLEIEEAELEEGEAPCYRNEHDDDSAIDPDVALSYIEEKLQNVLGHFQKDFEGGVSAENLGAKFGGYGSFLPTYQRSPSWSHQRCSSGAHDHDSPKTPKIPHPEDPVQNPLLSSSSSVSARPQPTPLKKASTLPSTDAKESASKHGLAKQPSCSSDQRPIKVRIKVGSENLPTQKNAEIYSGLGLDVSPSSSLDESPTISEKPIDLQHVSNASPTSILQVMTSLPVSQLLSPLSEDLIHLPEIGKHRVKSEYQPVEKGNLKGHVLLVNQSLSSRSKQNSLEEHKLKSLGKGYGLSKEPENQRNDGGQDNFVIRLKKETDIDDFGCEQLVSNALKLPLLSNPEDSMSKATSRTAFDLPSSAAKGRGENFSRLMEDVSPQTVYPISVLPEEDLIKVEKDLWSERKSLKAEVTDSSIQSIIKEEAASSKEGAAVATLKLSSGRKKKPKGIHGQGLQDPEVPKDEMLADSSLLPKSRKNSQAKIIAGDSESDDFGNDFRKLGAKYKDSRRDFHLEEDKESVSGEPILLERVNDSHLLDKRSMVESHDLLKENHNVKNAEKLSRGGDFSRISSNVAPANGHAPRSDAIPMGVTPLVNEDWVSCDKCQQWRLLPLGTNPKSLPDKWLCRMLAWLPGMNRCSIPEEETTKLVRARYFPAPDPESEKLNHPSGTSTGVALVGAADPGQVDKISQAMTFNDKKHRSLDGTNPNVLVGTGNLSNTEKEDVQTLDKYGDSSAGDHFPADGRESQHLVKSNGRVEEKQRDNEKKKISLSGNSSDKGKSSKIRNKREADLDGSRTSKRNKRDDLQSNDKKFAFDDDGASLRGGCSSSGGLPYNHSGNAKKISISVKNPNSDARDSSDSLVHASEKDTNDASKKRKEKEHHGAHIYKEPLPSGGRPPHHLEDSVEKTREIDQRKEKKARVSETEEKDTTGSKTSIDRKERSGKDQASQQNLPQFSLELADTGPLQTPVAANSSSSKVSGSRKSKSRAQKEKASPVESVSSSPLKFSIAEKPGRNHVEGDDRQGCGLLPPPSPERHFNGKNEVGHDQSGSVKEVATLTVAHTPEQRQDEERSNSTQSHRGSRSKSEKGSLSRSKDKTLNPRPDFDNNKIKVSDSPHASLEEKSKSVRHKYDEKHSSTIKAEKNVPKKDSAGRIITETGRGESRSKSETREDPNVIKSQDQQNSVLREQDHDKSSKKQPSGKINHTEVSGSGKSHPSDSARVHTLSGLQKENGSKVLSDEAAENGISVKPPDQSKISINQHGQPSNLRHPTPNTHKVRDIEAPSPVRRESSSHSFNHAIKEAKNLKHLADRLKHAGAPESTGLYFQAVLKFLHGASLMESGSCEGTKHSEMLQSISMYGSTAKLCEFVAHEYEKSKDMANAALAYKCLEVAYMRVIFCSRVSASRDRNELQTFLQIVAPGESPSSSASDVDNLNNQTTTEKAALSKVVGSPLVSGNHAITARNRSSISRLVSYAQDVSSAMEASRKSRICFADAGRRLGKARDTQGMDSIKKALDFNFQDVDGLLRLVRVAMEAISPSN